MPKQPTWVLIAFIAFLILGFLLGTRVYSGCIGTPPGWTTCAFYDVAKDFKEVFGWAIAMYVAYIAANPVWEQLKLMRVDNDISSIKFLEQDIEALKQMQSATRSILKPIFYYIQSHSKIDADYVWNGDGHANHQIQQDILDAITKFGGMQSSFEEAVENLRSDLIDALRQSCDCFYEMNLVEYWDFEMGESGVDIATARSAAADAANQIDGRIGTLFGARSRLDAGIDNAIAARTRLISDKKTQMVSSR